MFPSLRLELSVLLLFFLGRHPNTLDATSSSSAHVNVLLSTSLSVQALHPLDSIILHPRTSRLILWITFDTPETGSLTSVFAASAPEVHQKPEVYKGSYLMPVNGKAVPSEVVGQALDQELAKELWESTERMM